MKMEPTLVQNRDTVEAMKRVDAQDEKKKREEEEAYFYQLQLYRYAGILNAMKIAKEHSGNSDWTGEDVGRVLDMWRLVDTTVTNGSAEIAPTGFGPSARSTHMVTMAKTALASALSAMEKNEVEELNKNKSKIAGF